jgi:hypothetical protein
MVIQKDAAVCQGSTVPRVPVGEVPPTSSKPQSHFTALPTHSNISHVSSTLTLGPYGSGLPEPSSSSKIASSFASVTRASSTAASSSALPRSSASSASHPVYTSSVAASSTAVVAASSTAVVIVPVTPSPTPYGKPVPYGTYDESRFYGHRVSPRCGC